VLACRAKSSNTSPAALSLFGVYVVLNKTNGKRYVGKTTKGVATRWQAHLRDIRKKTHFYNAIRKHGAENFTVSEWFGLDEQQIIQEQLKPGSVLNPMEIALIARLRTSNRRFGYNSTIGGDGVSPTKDTRRRISEKVRAAYQRPDAKANVAARSASPIWRANVSAGLKENKNCLGRKMPSEHKAKIAAAITGKRYVKNPDMIGPRMEDRKFLSPYARKLRRDSKLSCATSFKHHSTQHRLKGKPDPRCELCSIHGLIVAYA